VMRLAEQLPDVLVGSDRHVFEDAAAALVASGVPAGLARRVAGLNPVFSGLDIVQVAQEGGREVETVAAVYFLLGARLELDWLRDQIVALPRDDRWRTLARAALRADLFAQHRDLTAQVLDQAAPANDAHAVVESWMSDKRPTVDRYVHVLADVKCGERADLAILSVLLRELRDLALAAAVG